MNAPLESPELLLYIAPFLSHTGLAAAAQVSRQWNLFFSPFLYHTIQVPQDWSLTTCFPPLPTLQKHAYSVRFLYLHTLKGIVPFLEQCVHLRTLVIYRDVFVDYPTDLLWIELTDLVRRNPLLELIIFGFNENSPPTPFLRTLLKYCPNLKRYESSQGRYEDSEQIMALMQVMTKVQMVASRYEDFCNLPVVQQLQFPYIWEVVFKDIKGMSILSQIDLLCQCPNLTSLKWTVSRQPVFPSKEFCERVPVACPKITELHMDGCGIPNPDDVSRIVGSLRGLELLTLSATSITMRSFLSMQKHFGTLRMLDVFDCFEIKSWMIEQILESCPHLEKLMGSQLRMSDIVQGKEWVATRLEYLQIQLISVSEPEPKGCSISRPLSMEAWTTFARLSKLTELKHLEIGCRSWSRRNGLPFRLTYGADQLRTLTKLRVLRFGNSGQRMTVEDVSWIGAHFEKLIKLDGILHTDWTQHLELANRLRMSGIEVPEENEGEWDLHEHLEYGESDEEYDDEYSDGEMSDEAEGQYHVNSVLGESGHELGPESEAGLSHMDAEGAVGNGGLQFEHP
ncbi:hypothetical protein BG011_007506 [Mortierella polycephala]|uniref:F-box domain-containing protein n=1 Tax=Mortierella polycephala TaxID=41804 RepID=A0A9P6PS70_9FUNG|nr:hypothetical protein BG011_007506 [Mortierella polycephala]